MVNRGWRGDELISEAVKQYGFENCKTELIRHNENMTYQVEDGTRRYVLRIHQPLEGFNLGFLRSALDCADLIRDEMRLLKYLSGNSNLGRGISNELGLYEG